MKRLGLTLVAAVCLTATTFAAGNQPLLNLIMQLSQQVLVQFNYHLFHMKIRVFGIQRMHLN